MGWKLDDKQSIYGQLMDVILRRIVTGIYPAGSKLGSVRELAQEAGVNPNTMQKALSELERTSIISTQRTSGKYVTEDQNMIDDIRMSLAKTALDHFFSEMKALGFERKDVLALMKEEEQK